MKIGIFGQIRGGSKIPAWTGLFGHGIRVSGNENTTYHKLLFKFV